jgi:hypothetical protein
MAETITVCDTFHVVVVKFSTAGDTRISAALPVATATYTLTFPTGGVSSTTVYELLTNTSDTETAVVDNATRAIGASASSTITVAPMSIML